jgi:hypothetical protein
MQRVRAPGSGPSATPALATSGIVSDGLLRIRGTGKPLGCDAPQVLRDALGLLGVGFGKGLPLLLGQLAGVHDDKPDGL